MSAPVGRELFQSEPREQVGAVTGARYEFQYHQAAYDALLVLDENQYVCIYCEWHDDYVFEEATIISYRFHQVKTRSPSEGPWSWKEFFGLKGRRAPYTADATAIFPKMFDHTTRFGGRCARFVFVTNAAVASEFDALLTEAKNVTSHSQLAGESLRIFQDVVAVLPAAVPGLDEASFLSFLQRLHVQECVGKLHDQDVCRLEIGNRIRKLSEVDLRMSEALRIGESLVTVVRGKSQRVLKALPSTPADLRSEKALVLEDILKLLSLSATGYRALKETGLQTVVALSRLHRLCQRSGIDESHIPDWCQLKTGWDEWVIAERSTIDLADLLLLKKDCRDVLRIYVSDRKALDWLVNEASALAQRYATIGATKPLTKSLVFGAILALAVEAEP